MLYVRCKQSCIQSRCIFFPDLVQAGFEEVQKLNQQNNQLSQCTTETAAGTVAHLEQKEDSYNDRKDEAAVEDEAREQEIVAELLPIKEEDKKEEEERSKKEEALWLSEERQLAAPNSYDQTDESTPDRYILNILFSKLLLNKYSEVLNLAKKKKFILQNK